MVRWMLIQPQNSKILKCFEIENLEIKLDPPSPSILCPNCKKFLRCLRCQQNKYWYPKGKSLKVIHTNSNAIMTSIAIVVLAFWGRACFLITWQKSRSGLGDTRSEMDTLVPCCEKILRAVLCTIWARDGRHINIPCYNELPVWNTNIVTEFWGSRDFYYHCQSTKH